jgi:Viral RNA-directed RNA-polymerase.
MLTKSEVLDSKLRSKEEVVESEVLTLTNALCDQFVDEIKDSAGLKICNDPYGYEYVLSKSMMNTCPFVRKSLKLYDRSMYEQIRGYSRKPELALTLATLKKYSSYQAKKRFRTEFEETCWEMAIRNAEYKFTFYGLVPLDDDAVMSEMETSTSAGFSYPGKLKKDVMNEIYADQAYMRHMIHDGRKCYIPPAKLAQRGHMHNAEEPKSRPVWVYPAETIVLEGTFAIPYIQKLKESNTVLIGENSMSRLIQLLNCVSSRDGKYSIAMDWSAFDTSIPNWLIDQAFRIIKNSFNMQISEDAEGDIHYSKTRKDDEASAAASVQANLRLFKWVQTNFKKTKIMLPNGQVLKKMHGIPSGSYFTQAVGSICNYIVISFIMYYMRIPWFEAAVLGDDSYIKLDEAGFDLNKAAAIAKHFFGMTLNVKKSSVRSFNEQQKFLGYEVQGLQLKRTDEEFAKLALYPERDVLTLEQAMSRVFAFYLLGGVNNPWYSKFFHQFLGHYAEYKTDHFTLSMGIYRTFKYVVGLDVTPFQQFPFDPGEISSLLCAYHFRFHYGIYKSDLFQNN